MKNKHFILLFFISPFILIGTIFSLNLIIDPFNITNTNLLNIKYKYARDDRTEKIERIKKIPYIQNLILGSSRAQHLDPSFLSETFGGYSYNFGVGGGTTAEALGLLLYLKSIDKLPKQILLVIDLSSFSGDGYHPSFLKTPELNFLSSEVTSGSNISKFLSTDAIRASFKTIKAHLKDRIPNSYFSENGLMVSRVHKIDNRKEKVKELAHKYYKLAYNSGNITFSHTKLDYLKRIVKLCKDNNIALKVTLSPVYIDQFNLIQNNQQFNNTISDFKKTLSGITPYCDAMTSNQYTKNLQLFEDSVHYTKEFGDLYLQAIYRTKSSVICQFK